MQVESYAFWGIILYLPVWIFRMQKAIFVNGSVHFWGYIDIADR